MIIAVALITTCSIFLSIILHALFFGNGDIEDVEMTKEELIEWIFQIAKDKMIFLDSKRPLSQEILSCVDFVKLNASEYENVSPRLKILYEHKFVVTLGSQGAMYKDKLYPSNNPFF